MWKNVLFLVTFSSECLLWLSPFLLFKLHLDVKTKNVMAIQFLFIYMFFGFVYLHLDFLLIWNVAQRCVTDLCVRRSVATLLLEECEDDTHTPEWGLGSPAGLSKLQSLIARVKTPWIEAFFISLKSYWSANVENGLAWAIWTFVA
jgi:hypothetical protein